MGWVAAPIPSSSPWGESAIRHNWPTYRNGHARFHSRRSARPDPVAHPSERSLAQRHPSASELKDASNWIDGPEGGQHGSQHEQDGCSARQRPCAQGGQTKEQPPDKQEEKADGLCRVERLNLGQI